MSAVVTSVALCNRWLPIDFHYAPFATEVAKCCDGPIAEEASLTRSLVGAGNERWRYDETKRLGGLDVDRQFELDQEPEMEGTMTKRPHRTNPTTASLARKFCTLGTMNDPVPCAHGSAAVMRLSPGVVLLTGSNDTIESEL
jgi:hypothetical protein